MKTKIQPHSTVDIITNSSSEIFVCNTNRSVEVIKTMLRELVSMYNSHHQTDYRYEDVFDDPYVVENGDEITNTYAGVGEIIIKSADDNSIPYAIMLWVEDAFNATRHHE